MKTVFSNSYDVMHVFAQRIQSRGKSSNVFFENDSIYSYGYHYELARFIEINGETCILIDNRGYSVTTSKRNYSVTTSKHISKITQATRQYKQYFTKNTQLKLVHSQISELNRKLLKARKPELYISDIIRLFNSFIQYPLNNPKVYKNDKEFKEIFKIFSSVSTPELLEKAKIAQKQKELKFKRDERKALKINLKKFENYEISYFINSEDFLRISKDFQFIETSQGVKVSIDSAKLLYSRIKAKRDVKGYNIEGYTVISINGHLKIGCHNINIDSVKKVGEKILNF